VNKKQLKMLADALRTFSKSRGSTFEEVTDSSSHYVTLIILLDLLEKYDYNDLRTILKNYKLSVNVTPVLFGPFDELPLLIYDDDIKIRSLARWRLKNCAPSTAT
jgi:hypothetical protein